MRVAIVSDTQHRYAANAMTIADSGRASLRDAGQAHFCLRIVSRIACEAVHREVVPRYADYWKYQQRQILR